MGACAGATVAVGVDGASGAAVVAVAAGGGVDGDAAGATGGGVPLGEPAVADPAAAAGVSFALPVGPRHRDVLPMASAVAAAAAMPMPIFLTFL